MWKIFSDMCCHLAGSVRSREHWLWDTARKGMNFFCFLFENPSIIAHNFRTTGPIQVGFSAKCTSPNEHFNVLEDWKCSTSDWFPQIASHYAKYISIIFVQLTIPNTTCLAKDNNSLALKASLAGTLWPPTKYCSQIHNRNIKIQAKPWLHGSC